MISEAREDSCEWQTGSLLGKRVCDFSAGQVEVVAAVYSWLLSPSTCALASRP